MSAEAAAPTKKSSKTLTVVLLAALVLGAGGGGAWWFLGGGAGGASAPREAKPIFSSLEPFTVNLLDDRGERFAQIGVILQVEDSNVDVQIKERLPALRNAILLLITSKRLEELITPEGKQQLADQVQIKAGEALGWVPPGAHDEVQPGARAPERTRATAAAPNPVRKVLFSQFIVQ
ncbi:flagellar basal body-associated FliL family protein [Ramlibacter sp. AW1]|uniref:Flagellar protein FliL n=1 Tax=Ramlibacter aurantiacus TaxID=2801330 RepID=A0A936ZPN9_9BURK|nr:flagellar basal body-associated FliL family protein [Ramlibacter aurantiacus]MBL0421456.1 flagellar basal body-associated FliL family protein [Ramlibacter aurantiacus]